ncbi:hypothetical protein Sros01_74060 [Streptomyces roseochromogenus]|nr:hypothetical protein Sros01_74060 [Streptomyces roseochromogenus]
MHITGEMDLDRAPVLRAALHTAITRPGSQSEIVVDLASLSFCASAGLNALLQARHTANEHGRHISLRAPQPQFLRLLETTGTSSLFPIIDT